MQKKKHIYADNAATTKLDPLALEAMLPFLQEHYGNTSSVYSFSNKTKKALDNAREEIAECIGATANEIYFTSGGTESNNWAIKGLAKYNSQKGKHIISSPIEHHAVLNSCISLEQQGMSITYLPVDSEGFIKTEDLQKAIRPDTICISIMLANNEIGTIQNIPALAKISQKHSIVFHSDAVQAVGHLPIDVNKLKVDLLSASAHKFNGPKGIGFLYKKQNISLSKFMDGGQQENNLRAGTQNVAAIVGMATALKNNIRDLNLTTMYLNKLTENFCSFMQEQIPSVSFNGSSLKRLPGHISVSIPNISAESFLHILDLKGISVSTGAACNSQKTKISHVLLEIGLSEDIAQGTLRISLSKNNTLDEVLTIAKTLYKLYNKKVI